MKTSRRQFIAKQLMVMAVWPFFSKTSFNKGYGIFDFNIGLSGPSFNEEFFNQLNLKKIAFKTIEDPYQLPGSLDALLLGGDSAEKMAIAISSIQAKSPVLFTVPAVGNMNQINQLKDKVAQQQINAGLLCPAVFLSSSDKVRQLLQQEEIGPLRKIKIALQNDYKNPYFSAFASGYLGDLYHLINISMHWLDLIPEKIKVFADPSTADASTPESNLTFANGIILTAQKTTKVQDNHQWMIMIEGQKGSIRLTDSQNILLRKTDGSSQIFNFPEQDYQIAFKANIEDFVNACKNQSNPRLGLKDAIISLTINHQAQQSASTGQEVSLELGQNIKGTMK